MPAISELMDMTGKVGIVTGGAGHIGKAIAEALLESGGSVVLVDRATDRLKDTSNHFSDYKDRVKTLTCDFEKENELLALPQQAFDQFGRMDILINNAAFVGDSELTGWVGPLTTQSNETWRRALNVNLTSTFSLIRDCAKFLAKSDSSSIINIGSVYGIVAPNPDLYHETTMGTPMAYGASKGGLFQLTRMASAELAHLQIRVNAISPGGVERGQPDVFKERYEKRVPLRRMATENDFKGATVFLASQMSAYVTGQVIQVDGGFTVW